LLPSLPARGFRKWQDAGVAAQEEEAGQEGRAESCGFRELSSDLEHSAQRLKERECLLRHTLER
jgi:hypothetical protein